MKCRHLQTRSCAAQSGQVAALAHIRRGRVSASNGGIGSARVNTKYVSALGGELDITVRLGDEAFTLAPEAQKPFSPFGRILNTDGPQHWSGMTRDLPVAPGMKWWPRPTAQNRSPPRHHRRHSRRAGIPTRSQLGAPAELSSATRHHRQSVRHPTTQRLVRRTRRSYIVDSSEGDHRVSVRP